MNDELRDVPGYEGRYAVTRDGRVWSYPKTHAPGKRGAVHGGKWMGLSRTKCPTTKQVQLSRDGAKHNATTVRLVKLAWGNA